MAGTIGNIQRVHQIAAVPFVIETSDDAVNGFLAGLPAPNFRNTADAKALWASEAANAGEGSVFAGGSAAGPGSAWVVSGEAMKRIKAHRFT